MAKTIIHCYIKGLGNGYAAFLHSTLGLIEYCEEQNLNIEVSYQYHGLSALLNSKTIDKQLPLEQRLIHVIHDEQQLPTLLKGYKYEVLHIACMCFERIRLRNDAHRLELLKIAFCPHQYVKDEFKNKRDEAGLNNFTYNLLQIRVHDKYVFNDVKLPTRKRKYILECIAKCCEFPDNVTTVIISNSDDVKRLVTKAFNIKHVFLETGHVNDKNIKSVSLMNTIFEFMLVEHARKVISLPMMFVKSSRALHAGYFAHMASQIFNVSYIELNTRLIYEKYHDVVKETMNSLES